jgi:hypothetical protein
MLIFIRKKPIYNRVSTTPARITAAEASLVRFSLS